MFNIKTTVALFGLAIVAPIVDRYVLEFQSVLSSFTIVMGG